MRGWLDRDLWVCMFFFFHFIFVNLSPVILACMLSTLILLLAALWIPT